MCSDSFQLLGMAERGFLPAALARRSHHGTPTLAIILSSIGILMLVSFDFLQVMMQNTVNGAGQEYSKPSVTPTHLRYNRFRL